MLYPKLCYNEPCYKEVEVYYFLYYTELTAVYMYIDILFFAFSCFCLLEISMFSAFLCVRIFLCMFSEMDCFTFLQ